MKMIHGIYGILDTMYDTMYENDTCMVYIQYERVYTRTHIMIMYMQCIYMLIQ